MYQLKDKHIDFILNDISARGVTIEDLQYNLLDHICCIIERNLEENGDFENFYKRTVQSFFKNDLKEIEEETISLIIFKNYYTMKKAMIISGTASVGLLSFGLFFKFMHWPGASIGILLGITILSLIFLPLMFILKIKEKQNIKDKITIGIGAFAGILISMGILFKIMHWPYANMMMNSSIAILMLLFLPFYFFSGIRNPETKVNTIVSSILLISATGLLFTLMRSPRATFLIDKQLTETYLRDDQLLRFEINEVKSGADSTNSDLNKKGREIIEQCDLIKKRFIEQESENGSSDLQAGLQNNSVMHEHIIQAGFRNDLYSALSDKLEVMAKEYNALAVNAKRLPITFESISNSKEANSMSCFVMLNQLTLVQRTVLQNERSLMACK
ncbi:MAG: hypothetical protein KBG47_01920 [Bacteroidia bacterium]|nr:hypothetical protein [Sphingobacteriaceae bacterium]MBP9068235.1 hypothetical protein [Bacteroidia bacterium]